MNKRLKGSILVLISATCFGIMPIFATFAYESGVNVSTLLFLRLSFASLVFFSYLFITKEVPRISVHEILLLIVLGGVLYTFQSFFYLSSIQYISPSLAALLLYLFPIIVLILSLITKQEEMTTRNVGSVVIAFIGILLVLYGPIDRIDSIGIFSAVGAASVYSVYILLGNKVAKRISPLVTSSFICLFASISFLMYGLVNENLDFGFTSVGWLSVSVIAIFSTVISIFTFLSGVNLIGTVRGSTISMIEPIITTFTAFLFLHQGLTVVQLIGGGIVVIGGILSVYK